MRVLSLQVGQPADAQLSSGRRYRTGYSKHRVDGPRWVSPTNIDGDGQADLVHHGGVHKAVLFYAAAHYPLWQMELGIAEPFAAGSFGENVTVEGLDEAAVCIGDVWQVGGVVLEVSQPRRPCWKMNARWGRDDMVTLVESTGRTGWYHRVLSCGFIASGDPVELLGRTNPSWTVARANHVMGHALDEPDLVRELSELLSLAPNWRTTLSERLDGRTVDPATRISPPEDLPT